MEEEENKNENYIKIGLNNISYEIFETILEQMKNCICLINYKKRNNGIGFFCKIPFPNSYNLLPVLITNNNILKIENNFNNEEIEIIMKKREIINLKLNKLRKIYFDKNYNIIFIEIKPLDNLNIDLFLEIDNKIYKENLNIEYKQKNIYLLNYLYDKDIEFCLGKIKNIENNKNIEYLCYNQEISIGCPIINLFNYKVIGIHKGNKIGYNLNIGIFIKNLIQDFYQNENFNYNSNNNNKFDNSFHSDFIHVLFSLNGRSIIIQASTDCMFAELVMKFMQKAEISIEVEPKFILYSQLINLDSCKTLKELNIKGGNRIEVVLGKDIIEG